MVIKPSLKRFPGASEAIVAWRWRFWCRAVWLASGRDGNLSGAAAGTVSVVSGAGRLIGGGRYF